MEFPSRLKALRLRNKMTQEELGKKINVTKVSVSGYETGNRTPDTDTLMKIAQVFDVSVDYLLGRTEDSTPSSPSASTLTEKDKRDIAKRLEEIRRDVASGDGLAFDGEPLSPEAQESFLDAMEYVLNTTKKINKKYTPKKYRKGENE